MADLTDEQREQLLRTIAELTTFVQAAAVAFAQALAPAIQATADQFAELQRQLQEAGLIGANGKPVKRDRPAWQSPYGPPQPR